MRTFPPHQESKHQIIKGPNGEPLFIVLPFAEYQTLCRARDEVEGLRAATETLSLSARLISTTPANVAHRIAHGENPVRVWREHRGLKAIELARLAGISAPYLSEIETGKKDGTFRIMAAIAKVLGVPLDALAPPQDETERNTREYTVLSEGILAQVNQLIAMVTGDTDFNTAAVRHTVAVLVTDAETLRDRAPETSVWLDGIFSTIHTVLELVDRAEENIISTARQVREDLGEILSSSNFNPETIARIRHRETEDTTPVALWQRTNAAE